MSPEFGGGGAGNAHLFSSGEGPRVALVWKSGSRVRGPGMGGVES